MIKVQIDVDEVWPVFFLERTEEDGPDIVEVNEEFYKEYLYFTLKYKEYQSRIKLIYDHRERELSQQSCGYRIPEGFEPDKDYAINKLRENMATKT